MSTEQIAYCNTCSALFDDYDGVALHQTLKNRKYAATLDETGNVLQECCEGCAQDIAESTRP